MINQKDIRQLEATARRLEPGPEIMDSWNKAVLDYGADFISRIYEIPAYSKGDGKLKALEAMSIEEKGKDIHKILDVLQNSVDSVGINPASGGHLGYIPGGGVYASSLADYLADITNRYSGITYANPGAVRMENLLIRWMADLISYPDNAAGNLASGGSIANLIAITAARDAKNISSMRVQKSVVYLSEQTHHCVHKALRIAGLGECTIKNVPLDDQYRMKVDVLRQMIESDSSDGHIPFLVVASIGSTDTGAVDPINAIADVCEAFDCWLHIDAAYGGFFQLIDELKHFFVGVERSDSYVVDPHKTLFLPYGIGAVLVRDGRHLLNSHYYRANYMQDAMVDEAQLSPADLSPELTKHFRGLRMWMPLQLYGLEPFKAAIKEKWMICRYFYEEVQKLGFMVGPEPDLSVCLYRYIPSKGDPDKFNRQLVEEVKNDGRVFISSTTIDGVYWIRLAIVCFRTHLDIVNTYLGILKEKLEAHNLNSE